ncbi:transcriptional-regulating factor 1 isoform X3 [Hypanus sabinus]|uniref:transcriptional-regulating factor 1 isoform X3 n=1 Tax=Hypanus sabinus TaxID=79690 RepID=UPI0028C4B103|nr:transcriptional-regulating factor 1 isoform X3 [Hypanus sabinus]
MMGDQPPFKSNHSVNNTENRYYSQQPQSSPLSGNMNHNYGSTGMETSQSSPASPHFPSDSREAAVAGTMPAVTKSLMIESRRPSNWPHSSAGNHIQMQNDLSNSSMMWTSTAQASAPDGYSYAFSSPAADTSSQKLTSDVLHKLDSFTQVFTNRNLRMQQANSIASNLPSQATVAESVRDSALRQLLSQKTPAEQQAAMHPIQRFQHAPTQQMHQGFPTAQSKQQLQAIHHHHQQQQQQQQQMYFEFQQLAQMQSQPQSMLQHTQSHVQQLQAQQVLPQQIQQLPQQQYFVRQQQSQQHMSVPDMQQQQQQQCHMHSMQFYQPQQILCQLQQPVQQQMQPPPPYHRNQNPKSMQQPQYSQEQSHPSQHIQMDIPSQYFYQDQAHYRHMYQQNQLHQQQEETMQQKQLHVDNRIQTSLGPHTSTSSLVMDEATRKELSKMSHPGTPMVPQRHLVAPPNLPQAPAKPSQQQSHNQTWSQISLTNMKQGDLTIEHSGQSRVSFQERIDEKSRLICTICHKEFKSLPALNGHMRSHGGQRASPKQEVVRKCQPIDTQSEDNLKPRQDKKKYRHRPEPLYIPPPIVSLSASYPGATLYQSQLRSPRIMGDHLLDRTQELPPYTPPPMLSPVRQGSGLFSSVISSSHGGTYPTLPITPLTPRILLGRTNGVDAMTITPGPGEQTVDIEPRINMGLRFQAAIPTLQDRSLAEKDVCKADLVWKPWCELENPEEQQKVEDMLNMACSSALPGGGTNRELALHCLFEAGGNILMAVEALLMKMPIKDKSHPLADYHYAGSDKWTTIERKMFNKALTIHNKDFFLVQKMIKTKTMAQCVEYYYTWKKLLRLGRKHRTRLAEMEAEGMFSDEDEEVEDEDDDDDRKSDRDEEKTEAPKSPLQVPVVPMEQLVVQGPTFMCEVPNCGAIFSSRQALNGHARIHGGSNQVPKQTSAAKLKTGGSQPGFASVKNSPAHSTTSGETDGTTIFPCKECGKMFYKIKSRNAHMKTHRQQEEQQRQKTQKALAAAEVAIIARPASPIAPILLHPDHMSMVKRHLEVEDHDIIQELEDVMDESNVMDTNLLLDGEDGEFLQDDEL